MSQSLDALTMLLGGLVFAGALLAGLFSEIGAGFYERLGFRTVPLDEVTITVTLKGGSPATAAASCGSVSATGGSTPRRSREREKSPRSRTATST